MPEPKLDASNARNSFTQLKGMSVAHCDAQIARLKKLKEVIAQQELLNELNACIASYETARDDISKREYENTPITSGMKGMGSFVALAGLTAVAVGPAVTLAAGIAAVAGGSVAAGVGSVVKNLTSQCTEGALMKPLVKAEEKTLAFFKKADEKIKSGDLNPSLDQKEQINKAKKEFKTESANFKKRVALFVIGGVYLLSAGVILAASHGALAPVALKIAMMGVKHVSAGLATATVATHAAIGLGLVTGGASMQSKRVAELKKSKQSEPEPQARRLK